MLSTSFCSPSSPLAGEDDDFSEKPILTEGEKKQLLLIQGVWRGSLARQCVGRIQEAQDLCEKHQWQHLRFSAHSSAIVRETKEWIGFYIENQKAFTDAIQEFTQFLCQRSLGNLIRWEDPSTSLLSCFLGWYGKVPLSLEQGKGQIGPLNLESFSPQQSSHYSICYDLIHLFPLHFQEIIDVIKKHNPEIEQKFYWDWLKDAEKSVLQCFQTAYNDHLAFVQKKEISLEDPVAFRLPNDTRKEAIKQVIEGKLREEHQHSSLKLRKCLGSDPNGTLKEFNKTGFPALLKAASDFIQAALKQKMSSSKASSNWELLSIRTLRFTNDTPLYEKCVKQISKSILMISFQEGLAKYKSKKFARWLLDCLFEEWVQGGEIAYYHSTFGNSPIMRSLFC